MPDDKDKPAQWPLDGSSPELNQLWEVTGAWRGGPEPALEPALERLHQRLATEKTSPVRTTRRRLWTRLSVAATLLIVVAAAVWLSVNQGNTSLGTVTTAEGVATFELPDGSHGRLNKHSSLRWDPEQFDAEERVVYLTGEAFFNVSPNPARPFRVVAGSAEVQVLGTSFNLRAYPTEQETEVAVMTGQVAFTGAGQRLELAASQCARHRSGEKPQLAAMPVVNAVAWQTGELVFKNTPLPQVIVQLERFYDVQIDWDADQHTSAESCTVSAIWKARNLEQVLGALEKITGLHSQRLDQGRYHLAGNCTG
jgi:ferric-dicitrate binding protein FerR (iron transport regulator)